MIIQGHEHTGPLKRRTHTVVVGSGAGGAVVAQILAKAGVETVVLEEGGHFTAQDFTQREDEMFSRLFRAGGFQFSHDGMINVLQGSCFGGSTLINMGDCEPTPPEVYAHWERLLGITELNDRSLEASQQRVMQTLQVNPIRRDQVNPNNALVLEGAKRLGWSAGAFLNNRVGCVGSGYCLLGCAYDAKRGASLNYLPQAVAAGADVYSDLRAERIERLSADRFVVHGSVVERGSRVSRWPARIEANRVVLAAGAVHTPALIKHSGLDRGLPELGRNVSLQPQMAIGAVFDSDREVKMWRGIPQSTYCSEFDDNTPEHGLGGFRLEAVHAGLSTFAGVVPGFGHQHKEYMAKFAHTGGGLMLVPDRPSGQMSWKRREGKEPLPRIDYSMSEEWKQRLRRGLRTAAELYFEVGAREIYVASELCPPLKSPDDLGRLDALPVRTGVTRFISAHVQGSCRMGLDAKTSVVDQDHRLHTIENLYVVDASVMPTTASTHTMIPIMTLADRAAHRMLES